jgi:hypothetical protein
VLVLAEVGDFVLGVHQGIESLGKSVGVEEEQVDVLGVLVVPHDCRHEAACNNRAIRQAVGQRLHQPVLDAPVAHVLEG